MWIRKSMVLSVLVMTTGLYGFGSSDLEGFDQAIRDAKVSMDELFRQTKDETALNNAHNALMERLNLIYMALLRRCGGPSNPSH